MERLERKNRSKDGWMRRMERGERVDL